MKYYSQNKIYNFFTLTLIFLIETNSFVNFFVLICVCGYWVFKLLLYLVFLFNMCTYVSLSGIFFVMCSYFSSLLFLLVMALYRLRRRIAKRTLFRCVPFMIGPISLSFFSCLLLPYLYVEQSQHRTRCDCFGF